MSPRIKANLLSMAWPFLEQILLSLVVFGLCMLATAIKWGASYLWACLLPPLSSEPPVVLLDSIVRSMNASLLMESFVAENGVIFFAHC